MDNPDTIYKMNPIASSDKNFLLLNNMKKLISQYTRSLYPEFHDEKELKQSVHDYDHLSKDLSTARFTGIPLGDSTTVKKSDTSKVNAAGIKKTDHRKTEKLGLAGFILSFLGIVPYIGIPFAILAIIFGARSLKKIKRNPEKYKGKGYAIASIAIGCAIIATYIVILIVAASNYTDPNPNHTPKVDCN